MRSNPFDEKRMRGIALALLAVFPSATALGVQTEVSKAATAGPHAAAHADNDLNELFRARTVASPQVLAQMRGGFVGTAGGQTLQLAFGIDQALFVNGQLLVTTRITVPNLSQPAGAQVQNIVAPVPPTPPTVVAPTPPTVVALTPPTIVAPTPPTPPTIVAPTPPTPPTVVTPTLPIVVVASTTPTVTTVSAPTHGVVVTTVSAPATTSSQASAAQATSIQTAPAQSNAAAAATPAPAVVASPAGMSITTIQTATGVSNVVQIGPGNAFSLNTTQLPSGVLNVIQNSLDNQTIRQTTNIQLSANSLGVMRALNFGSALQRQVLGSIR